MMIRDLELRWGDGKTAHDWFWKRLVPEWIFVAELRKLRICTPNKIAKVNIYFGETDEGYWGEVFDGVTDVTVAASWEGVESWPTELFIEYVVELIVAGLKKVLDTVQVESGWLDALAERVRLECQTYSQLIGNRAEKSSLGYSARLYVKPASDLRWCMVVLQIKKGRQLIGEREVCTTFPDPQRAIRDFEHLSWEAESMIDVQFDTAGARGRRIYGRENYDCSGLNRVVRLDQDVPRPPHFSVSPKFRIDLSDLLPLAGNGHSRNRLKK